MRVKQLEELNRATVEEYKLQNKIPLIVVLDNIRSLNNIGSVFRSSDAFNVESIYLCGITATPPHVDIHKTALGAEDTVAWRYFEETVDAVEELKLQNVKVCAVELTTSSVPLNEFKFGCDDCKYAIVVGNEVKGVQQQVVDLCDCAIEIPQEGVKHSLNVSVATGVVLWELYKQFKEKN